MATCFLWIITCTCNTMYSIHNNMNLIYSGQPQEPILRAFLSVLQEKELIQSAVHVHGRPLAIVE